MYRITVDTFDELTLLLASEIGLCTERPYWKLARAGKIIPHEALV